MKIKDPLFDDVIIRRVVFKTEKLLLKRDRIKIQQLLCQFSTWKKPLWVVFNSGPNSTLHSHILGIYNFGSIFKQIVKITGLIFNLAKNSTLHRPILRK